MTNCPGVCNAAWRGTGEGEPRMGNPVWCYPDGVVRIHRQLAEIDDLAAQYDFQVTGYAQQGTSPAHGGHDDRSPSPATDYVLNLQGFFLDWEDAYRSEHNKKYPDAFWPSPARRGHLFTVLTTSIGWLGAHLADLLEYEAIAADFGLEVGQRYRELAAKTAAIDPRRRGIVPCPNCGLMLLGWVDGYDGLICGACGRYVTREEYDDDCKTARRRLETAS